MKISVEVSKAELDEMMVTPDELKAALIEQLDRGVTTDDGGGSVDDLPSYTIIVTVIGND